MATARQRCLLLFRTGSCISKVQKHFRPISGDMSLFASSQRRHLEAGHFAATLIFIISLLIILLIFIPLTPYEKTTFFPNKRVGVLRMAFRNRRVFGLYRDGALVRRFGQSINETRQFCWTKRVAYDQCDHLSRANFLEPGRALSYVYYTIFALRSYRRSSSRVQSILPTSIVGRGLTMPQVKAIGKRICEVLTRKQQKYHNVATSMTNKGMDKYCRWNGPHNCLLNEGFARM